MRDVKINNTAMFETNKFKNSRSNMWNGREGWGGVGRGEGSGQCDQILTVH